MIRILHVVGIMHFAGLETMIMNYYRNIDRKRYSFDFVVHTQKVGDYDEEIESLGGTIYHAPVFHWYNHKAYEEWWMNLLREKKFDIIHSHNGGGAYVFFPIAKTFGVKTILHSHTQVRRLSIKAYLNRFRLKKACENATALFACSKSAGKYMFGKREFKIINNAIDPKKFEYNSVLRNEVRSHLYKNENVFLIGCVGRLCSIKNPLFSLKVFYEYRKRNSNARMLFVGSGDLEKELRENIALLGLGNFVTIFPAQKNVNMYYMAMDCLLFPSVYEGLGMVAIEAQTTGLPVVMSDGVPYAAAIDKCRRLSLKAPLQDWVDALESYENEERKTIDLKKLSDSGFNICLESQFLMKMYDKILGI